MRKLLIILLSLNLQCFTQAYALNSIKIKAEVYGALKDNRGGIGGGKGYYNLFSTGDYICKTPEELLRALSLAKSGEVVFIPGSVEIDFTTLAYIEQTHLEIPSGVTLAGDRGRGTSLGAKIICDCLELPVLIYPKGENVRITGLRIQGPNSKQYKDHHKRSFQNGKFNHAYYYAFPVQGGIVMDFDSLEVDNCEISGFSHAGIFLRQGINHHVHHNSIHHCQYHGLGYGVCLGDGDCLIECNHFNWNRHSIAGTGVEGSGYIARNNIVEAEASSHCFDMHGGKDRRDGTATAGTKIEIHNNTFTSSELSVSIRGVPSDACEIHHNWFKKHDSPQRAVKAFTNTSTFNNAYGLKHPAVK